MDYKYYDNDTTENRLQNKLLKSKESPFTGGFEFADEEDENELNDFSTSANRNGEPSTTKTINHQKKSANNTPFLDKFGTDLTRAAKDGILDPIVGREKEIERVSQILSRRNKNNL